MTRPNPHKVRCSALIHAVGPDGKHRRCRNWVRQREGETGEPPLCAVHARREPPPAARRCTGLTRKGERCRRLAQIGSDRCAVHSSSAPPEERRCGALTATGARCRRWATPASLAEGEPRCPAHSGLQALPRATDRRRCTAINSTNGERCRYWAMRDSEPPLCATHALKLRPRRPGPADYEAGRVCTAISFHTGERCPQWASPGTEPPLCWMHANPDKNPNLRHQFYRRSWQFSEAWRLYVQELAAQGDNMGAELTVLRLKLRDVVAYLDPDELAPGDFLPAMRVYERAVGTLLRLVRQRRKLEEEGLLPQTDEVEKKTS